VGPPSTLAREDSGQGAKEAEIAISKWVSPRALRAKRSWVGVLETRQSVCCKKEKDRCRAPERFRAGSKRVGAPERAAVLCGEKKNRQVSGPRALRAVSDWVQALERSVVLLRKETMQLLYIPNVGQSVIVGVF